MFATVVAYTLGVSVIGLIISLFLFIMRAAWFIGMSMIDLLILACSGGKVDPRLRRVL
ncbi:hypothetical protein [Streptomyces kaempferi]|uniref:hypothetical protein n=1 Tax=Streptomyces kaempferi TaxID=333725 RepID=UPI0036D3B611